MGRSRKVRLVTGPGPWAEEMAGAPAVTRAMGRVPQSLLPLLCETFGCLVATVGCDGSSTLLFFPHLQSDTVSGFFSRAKILSGSSMPCFSVASVSLSSPSSAYDQGTDANVARKIAIKTGTGNMWAARFCHNMSGNGGFFPRFILPRMLAGKPHKSMDSHPRTIRGSRSGLVLSKMKTFCSLHTALATTRPSSVRLDARPLLPNWVRQSRKKTFSSGWAGSLADIQTDRET